MWAPAFGRVVARRTADRGFTAALTLRRWGATGAQVILRPLLFPLAVYGASYAVAWGAGFAHWNPGEGRWITRGQVAANLILNLSILGVFGTITAMGEELGWRGYLQPRLDAAAVGWSVAVVSLVEFAYHAPLMLLAGYAEVRGPVTTLVLFAIGQIPVAFIMASESYRAQSLWPAVLFHSFHNTISQWLFPKLFTVDPDQVWLRGEAGLMPMIGYLVLGASMFVWMSRHGPSWQTLVRGAIHDVTNPTAAIVRR
jgi:membrane protease YdiL (CAAX protease family)